MKKVTVFLLIFVILIPMYTKAEEISEINLYVSANGSDDASGEFDCPLKTLEGARKKVREYIKQGKDINVNFFGGEYEVKETAVFEAQDSAMYGTRITYRAYDDAEVIFKGSHILDVKLFEPVSENNTAIKRIKNTVRDKIGCIDLKKAGINDLGKYIPPSSYMETVTSMPKLYLNDNEQQISRWPNVGYSTIDSVIDGGALKKNNDYSGRPVVIGYTDVNPDRWVYAKDAIIEGFFRYEYAFERLYIDNINTVEKTITTKDSTVYGVAQGKRWGVVNLLEEMDIPGEYYIDSTNLKLYFYPPYGIKNSVVELSVLTKPMITAENLNCVTFKGLTFKNTRARVGEFTNCTDIHFENCNIKNIGHQAFNMLGAYNTVIDGCSFENIGGDCIYIDGGNRTTLAPANNYITNNTFYKMGRETKTYAGAVDIRGVGTYVEHNVMHEAPHQVIRFYGNDHKIRYNEIYNVVKETLDSSAIYCGKDYTMRGNEISYNYIHDISTGVDYKGIYASGIYLDDQWSGAYVHHNVFVNTNMGLLGNSGRDNIFDSNIFVNCENSILFTNRGEAAGRSYTLPGGEIYKRLMAIDYTNPPYSTKYPELAALQYELDCLGSPKNNTIKNNLIYKSGAMNLADSVYKYAKILDNNIETDEPVEFADSDHGDYSLKNDSDILNKIPELRDIDVVSGGVSSNTARLDIGDFRLIYPKNGEVDVNYSSQFFMWDNASGADFYEFVLAEDADFKNIVCCETTRYNYYQGSNLEKGKKYYWTVTAKNYSRQNPQEKTALGSGYLFRTYSSEYVDYEVLDSNIEKANKFCEEITEGENVGEYPVGSKDRIRQMISECRKIKRKIQVTKKEIELCNSRLVNLINDIKNSSKCGYVLLSDFDIKSWSGNAKLTFTDSIMTVKNGVASYNRTYTGREMLCFDIKMVHNGKWAGFALKQDKPNEYVYSQKDANAYLVEFKEDVIELYRYKNGISKTLTSLPNTYVNEDRWYSIQVGAINVKDGVRIIMYIDNEYIFDYTDKSGAIINDGSFTFYDEGDGDGISVRKTENIPVEDFDINKEIAYPEPVEVKGLFNDKNVWSNESLAWNTSGNLTVGEKGISAEGTHFYSKNMLPADSVLKFKAKFNMGESWQAISLKNSKPDVLPWKASTNDYLIALKQKSIEIQKFEDGKNEYIAILKNEYVNSGEWHDYEITLTKVLKGVRFILKIDENVLVDYVDENPIISAGYVGFYDLSGLGIEIQEEN